MPSSPRLVASPLPEFGAALVVDLDVRDDLRSGREPLARILAAAEALPAGFVLHLRTTFQPAPLFAVLARLGFAFHTQSFSDDDCSSWFWRGDLLPVTPPAPPAPAPQRSPDIWDMRGLAAPEPLARLLERIADAPAAFEVWLPAYSEMLGGILSSHGWSAATIESVSSGVRLRIAPTGSGAT